MARVDGWQASSGVGGVTGLVDNDIHATSIEANTEAYLLVSRNPFPSSKSRPRIGRFPRLIPGWSLSSSRSSRCSLWRTCGNVSNSSGSTAILIRSRREASSRTTALCPTRRHDTRRSGTKTLAVMLSTAGSESILTKMRNRQHGLWRRRKHERERRRYCYHRLKPSQKRSRHHQRPLPRRSAPGTFLFIRGGKHSSSPHERRNHSIRRTDGEASYGYIITESQLSPAYDCWGAAVTYSSSVPQARIDRESQQRAQDYKLEIYDLERGLSWVAGQIVVSGEIAPAQPPRNENGSTNDEEITQH